MWVRFSEGFNPYYPEKLPSLCNNKPMCYLPMVITVSKSYVNCENSHVIIDQAYLTFLR